MIICTTSQQLKAPFYQCICQSRRILADLCLISLKLWLQCLSKTNRLRCYHMLQRTSLTSREDCLVKVILFCRFLIGQNHSASGTTQCLVRCRSHYICIWNRTWMLSCCHQTGNMSHIYHQAGSHFVCHFAKPFKINPSGISAGPCHNQLRLIGNRNFLQLIIINISLIINPIRHNVKI